jgi:glyoxylase-like metal-dependent hydrolase (beta-lactamase superfamily II)
MGENCYIVIDEGSKQAIVLDPGENAPDIIDFILSESLEIKAILLTHCHFDHIGAVKELKERLDAPVVIPKGEEIVAGSTAYNLSAMFGCPLTLEYDRTIDDGEELKFGSLSLKAISTPGHTPGGMCYYFANEGIVFTGDTLFYMSVGRTDFPLGSYSQLMDSIKNKLFTLPYYVKAYPGHGEHTDIAYEKLNNIYVS